MGSISILTQGIHQITILLFIQLSVHYAVGFPPITPTVSNYPTLFCLGALRPFRFSPESPTSAFKCISCNAYPLALICSPHGITGDSKQTMGLCAFLPFTYIPSPHNVFVPLDTSLPSFKAPVKALTHGKSSLVSSASVKMNNSLLWFP